MEPEKEEFLNSGRKPDGTPIEPEKKDVWEEFEKLFENENVVKLQVGMFKSDVQINTNALKSFIKTHFIPRAEVVEKIEKLKLNGDPHGNAALSHLLDLLTQEK